MKLGRVIGTVTATAKDAGLSGRALLIVDLTDAAGKVTEPSVVAVDTVGAGQGDQVLVAFGSAARMPAGAALVPTDAAILAVVDRTTP